MKNFFVYIAVFMVLAFCIVIYTDYGSTERAVLQFNQEVSSACENASGMIISSDYGEGYYAFNDTEVIKQVELALREEADSKIEILDKAGKRTYKRDADGHFKKVGATEAVTFPYTYINHKGESVSVNNPAVVLTSTLTGNFYKILGDETQSFTKQIMYEAVGYADI